MNKIVTAACFIFIAACTSTSNAQRAGLTYVEQTRSVSYVRSIGTFVAISERIDNTELGSFNATLNGQDFNGGDPYTGFFNVPGLAPAATQSSSINFNSIVASGSSDSFRFDDQAGEVNDLGDGFLNTVFDLDGPAAYSFDASVIGSYQIVLNSDNFSEPLFVGIGTPDSVSQAGVLEAGRYDVTVFAEGYGDSSGSFELDFQINAVPEPSTFVLLLGCSVGITVLRRREI